MSDTADKIRELRGKGLFQKEIAEELGISQQRVSQVLNPNYQSQHRTAMRRLRQRQKAK